MGGGSYLSMARIAAFFVCVWCGSQASKKAGVSTIVAEIVIGLVLGPRVLGLMPSEYAQCAFEDSKMDCDLLRDHGWHDIRGHKDLEHMVHEEEEYCQKPDQIKTYGTVEKCLLAKCDEHLLHECAATPDIFTLLGHIGVSMMIFEAGMHVDFDKVRMVGVKACMVAVIGTFTPIILATLLIGALGYPFAPDGLAVGISLSPTSIGISLKLLGELGVLDKLFGQAIIVAAVVDDILALICFQAFFAVASPGGGIGAALGKLAAGVIIFGICAATTLKHWPMWMERILKDKSTEGKFSPRDQLHFFIMFMTLLVYATGFNFIGSHLWGCFVGGLSFTAVPNSHHLWVNQTKRSVKWMIRVFFACTVGFSIPIEKLLTAKSFGYGMIIGAIPCLGAKVCCAPFMGDAKWVIGWGMCGRAEFAYYIAAGALTSLLMSKEIYAITIWSLLCATIVAPFAFRFVLQKYTKKLQLSHRATFMDVPPEVLAKLENVVEPAEPEEQVVKEEAAAAARGEASKDFQYCERPAQGDCVLPVVPPGDRNCLTQSIQTEPWLVQIYPFDADKQDADKQDVSTEASVSEVVVEKLEDKPPHVASKLDIKLEEQKMHHSPATPGSSSSWHTEPEEETANQKKGLENTSSYPNSLNTQTWRRPQQPNYMEEAFLGEGADEAVKLKSDRALLQVQCKDATFNISIDAV